MMSTGNSVVLVGLGNMGLEIAAQLAQAGVDLVAMDLSPARCQLAANRGVKAVTSVADLPQATTLVLSLPSPTISRRVIEDYAALGAAGVVVVETSTVAPSDMQQAAQLCTSLGFEIVDAAVMAGVDQMAAGTAMLLLGGRDELLDSLTPIFQAISQRQLRFGEIGSGMAAKVVNNAVAHALMTVFVEAGAMATASGVSIDRLLELLTDPVMGIHRPLTHRYAERVRNGTYAGGMPTSAARKDSVLALQLAQEQGVPLFAIQACHTVYDLAVAEGFGDLDYASIAKLWDQWGAPAAAGRTDMEVPPPRAPADVPSLLGRQAR